MRGNLRDPHAKAGLVGVNPRVFDQREQLWDGVTEAGAVLCGHIDGDGEDGGRTEKFGGGGDDGINGGDGGSEGRLDIAYAGRGLGIWGGMGSGGRTRWRDWLVSEGY